MKYIIFFFVLFAPQIVCGAEVTQDTLSRLGFYEASQVSLLENNSTWKCGVIEGQVWQYHVSVDILGYNTDTGEWLRLITPMSTDLPVTAFGVFMDSDSIIRRQITVMTACTKMQEKMMEKPQKIETVQPTEVGEQMLSKTVVVPEASHEVKKIVTVIPVKRESQVTQQNNLDVTKVSSTWELMAIYQRQMEEKR